MRLKKVVLPAPLGPMMAAIWPGATVRLTPPTARKPSNAFRMSRTSSTARSPEAPPDQLHGAGQAAREHEQQEDQDAAEHERPVLGVDRKSTRLNSSHRQISYAVFCLKKKKGR